MASRRPKHKAPVLFGERMRLALADTANGETTWVRVYGDIWAQLTLREGNEYEWHYKCGLRGGYSGTLAGAIAGLESLIRRTGRALPAAALVSRKEWRLTNG